MADQLSRRAFLAATTTTAAAAFLPLRLNTAQVIPGKLSPNEKMRIAGIGVGGKGLGDIMSCRRENIVALCDPDWERAGEAFYRLKDAKQYKDYRKMLEEMGDGIDACTISTPDHSHALAAYMAMKMGKHVYVQKPLTHTIAEARLLTKTARETGVTTQMGNQGHCGNGVRELCEMIWAGAIGTVKEAHIWTNRPIWPQGMTALLPEQPVPDTLDWDLWLGPAAAIPYNKGYAPFNWRGWWAFGCGAIGDMACHIMDPAFWALRLYEAKSYSVEVVRQDGMTEFSPPTASIIKFQFPARGDMGLVDVYWYDGKLLPERPAAIPQNQKLGAGDNGSLFIGSDGYATAGEYGDDARLLPDERMKDYTRPPKTLPRVRGQNPYYNWIKACKGEDEAASHFDYAGPLTEAANMGNVALLAGERIEFDVETMRITNS
ncbi:MAG TPA: Gfo/Idh/MocA family oxidoreductase, partial [Candidatus Hydrogenedentes bacterium]|nr:Gfo/Idh/MocA family oxidoreductase [Candidatus Hydrogenedentota bacterium]